jgi:hypothetical protein
MSLQMSDTSEDSGLDLPTSVWTAIWELSRPSTVTRQSKCSGFDTPKPSFVD